jgi:GGDEF domain-containing protein
MIIDKDAIGNSDFFMYSDEEVKKEKYINNIDIIINKYNITVHNNSLIENNENKFISIINYTTNLYFKNIALEEDLTKLFLQNYPFKKSLNHHLEKKLENLIKNDTAIFFKEITTMIHLLCLGQNYEVFKSYNEYNYDDISNLFRFYEKSLSEQKENEKDLYDTTFDSYIILLKVYTQLCVVNSTDLMRKKSINKIIDLMTETINMLKFSLLLDEDHMNPINNILGIHLYYFSHFSYIKIKKDDVDYTLKEYHLYFERQIDGYNLAKSTNFGKKNQNNNKKNEEYVIFRNNASFLLLTLLQKLNFTFKAKNFFTNKNFQKLLELYYDKFSLKTKDKNIAKSSYEFKRILLDSLLYNYHTEVDSSNIVNHTTIIDDFISAGHNFCNTNLETIHNILLFSDDIEDFKYIHIAQLLVATQSIQNDYHEFFKLKTLDVIINYFINKKYTSEIEELFSKMNDYVELNKTASHLLSAYSKIYLSLSLYYSYHVEAKNLIQKAKVFYAIFIQSNGVNSLKKEYERINSRILINFGKYYTQELKISNMKFSDENYVDISKNMIKKYLLCRELELKFEINKGITVLTNKIFNDTSLHYDEINEVLVNLISKKIFLGLCQVFILGLHNTSLTFFDTGYKQYKIKMNEQYSILFIFPIVYEENFKYILQYNKIFIQSNISNILLALNKKSEKHIDSITGLKDISKLNELIKQSQREKFSFVEISIESLSKINKDYGLEEGNIALKDIANNIKNISSENDVVVKLNGSRIGILLDDINTYKDLFKKLEVMKINIQGETIHIEFYLVLTTGSKDLIISKSSRNMDKAVINKIRKIIDIY